MKINKGYIFLLIIIPLIALSFIYFINSTVSIIATIIYISGFFVIIRTLSDQGLEAINFIFEDCE